MTTGSVLACEPPRLLEVTWLLPDEPTTRLRVTLDERATGAHLVLDHTQLPPNQVGGHAAGWHAYLARLEAALQGDEPPAWDAVFAREVDAYRARATAGI